MILVRFPQAEPAGRGRGPKNGARIGLGLRDRLGLTAAEIEVLVASGTVA